MKVFHISWNAPETVFHEMIWEKSFKAFKHFWIFPRERNYRMLIGLWKEVFMNHPIKFLDGDKKTKLVPASFSDFLELLWEKN